LQAIARVIPLTYVVDPFGRVMMQGAGLGTIAPDLGILLAWTAASWVVAIRSFRWQ
jgi:ABC-type multidrug transport system permease subunit